MGFLFTTMKALWRNAIKENDKTHQKLGGWGALCATTHMTIHSDVKTFIGGHTSKGFEKQHKALFKNGKNTPETWWVECFVFAITYKPTQR
jgi:hypothetical protein